MIFIKLTSLSAVTHYCQQSYSFMCPVSHMCWSSINSKLETVHLSVTVILCMDRLRVHITQLCPTFGIVFCSGYALCRALRPYWLTRTVAWLLENSWTAPFATRLLNYGYKSKGIELFCIEVWLIFNFVFLVVDLLFSVVCHRHSVFQMILTTCCVVLQCG